MATMRRKRKVRVWWNPKSKVTSFSCNKGEEMKGEGHMLKARSKVASLTGAGDELRVMYSSCGRQSKEGVNSYRCFKRSAPATRSDLISLIHCQEH
jgi:hypothetical protein